MRPPLSSLARVLGVVAVVSACSATAPPAGTETAPSCTSRAYPEGSAIGVGRILPELALAGLRENGARDTIRLHEHYEPCASEAKLTILRVHGGTWCGTCLWHAAHGRELLDGPLGPRLRMLDLVVRGPDGDRARVEDLPGFRAKVDRPDRIATVIDPEHHFRALSPGAPLPLYVFVDVRTMRVEGYASNPSPDALEHQVRTLLARLDGKQAPGAPAPALIDGHFSRDEWDLLTDIGKQEPLPRDPSNAVADDPAARALGAALFADPGFSPKNDVSCKTCHEPDKHFSDGLPHPSPRGTRRTPRIALAAYARWQFWDGRADSLWSQALGPLENPDEIASSRARVARRVLSTHRDAYERAFPGHPLPDAATVPADGKPGDPAFDSLSPATRERITRVFVNVGKAIAAFERTLPVPEMRIDRYARGDRTALTSLEKSSLAVFMQSGCMQCHFGPRLTNDAFHVTRMATGRPDGVADRGRYDGLLLLAKSETSRASRYSDALTPFALALPPSPETLGAFKTPSLRGIVGGGPFGHGGTLRTLVEVTEHYGRGGLPESDSRTTGALEPWLPTFDEAIQWAIVPFLESLGSTP